MGCHLIPVTLNLYPASTSDVQARQPVLGSFLLSCHRAASTGPRASVSEGASFILISFERRLRLREMSSLPKVTQLVGGQDENPTSRASSPIPSKKEGSKWKRHLALMRAAQLAGKARQDTQGCSQGCGSCGELWFWRQPGFKPLSTT